MSDKPILCLDFDGVINSYASGWVAPDFIPDPPVPGALDFMYRALEHFQVQIFSSRSNPTHGTVGIRAMRIYIEYWARKELSNEEPDYQANTVINKIAWAQDAFPIHKPPAFLAIDDRAMEFTGNWGAFDPEQLLGFKPWNKR